MIALRVILVLFWVTGTAGADTPLPAPENWETVMDSGTVVAADLETQSVIITPPSREEWVIPGWHRQWSVHVAPDGRHVLISNPGGNLIGSEVADDVVVLRLWEAPGLPRGAWTRAELAQGTDPQRTASHDRWIDTYRWRGEFWEFEVPDGPFYRLFPEAGTLVQLR